tara:strand:+ start:1847 stop:2632 length:786 start_codon:yes stop_codon:yes gene_type:complete
MTEKPSILFSITSCKRLDLFKRTVNSFLNSCEDLSLISEWICVDDNSSKEDRDEMLRFYPFINFIFKGEKQKGHPESMNIIRERALEYDYLLHLEDDWTFTVRKPYVNVALHIMEQKEEYMQVVFNRNYSEELKPNNVDVIGGFKKRTGKGVYYVEHEFYPKGSEGETAFYKKNPGSRSCCYWPHFSLNPSLTNTKVFKELGEFKSGISHFEMEYANRYVDKGYRTCFLDDIYCSHIGRKINEAGQEGLKNAYELNETKQF